MDIERALKNIGACREGAEWATEQPDPSTAWATCERADWMLWLLGRLAGPPDSYSRMRLVCCMVECAETALKFIRDKVTRDQVRYGLALLRRYLTGQGDLREARKVLNYAAAATYAAARDAAAGTYAAASAWAAAYAAAAAAAAVWGAWAAARDAAMAAAWQAVVWDAAWTAARSKALKGMSDIVRRHYPQPPELPARPVEPWPPSASEPPRNLISQPRKQIDQEERSWKTKS